MRLPGPHSLRTLSALAVFRGGSGRWCLWYVGPTYGGAGTSLTSSTESECMRPDLVLGFSPPIMFSQNQIEYVKALKCRRSGHEYIGNLRCVICLVISDLCLPTQILDSNAAICRSSRSGGTIRSPVIDVKLEKPRVLSGKRDSTSAVCTNRRTLSRKAKILTERNMMLITTE